MSSSEAEVQTINEKRAELPPLTSSEANQCRFIRDKIATHLESRFRSHMAAFQVIAGIGKKVMPIENFKGLLHSVFGEDALKQHGQEQFIVSLVDPFELGFLSAQTFVTFSDLDTHRTWDPSHDVDVPLAVLLESTEKKATVDKTLQAIEQRLYNEAESLKDLFKRLGPVNGYVTRDAVVTGLTMRNISEAEAELMWVNMAKEGQEAVDYATFASIFSDPDPANCGADGVGRWSGPAFVPSIASNAAVSTTEKHESSSIFPTVTDTDLLESRKWSSDVRCEQVIQSNIMLRLEEEPSLKGPLATEIIRAAFQSEDDSISMQEFERILMKVLDCDKMMPPVILYLEKTLAKIVPANPNRVHADAALAFLGIQESDMEDFQKTISSKSTTPKTPRQMSRMAASASSVDKNAPHARANRKVLQTIAGQIEEKSTLLARTLRSFDPSGSGSVSVEDYLTALSHVGIFISEADFARLVAVVDEEGSGEIKYGTLVQDLRAGIAAEKPAVFLDLNSAELAMTRQFENLSGCFGKTSILGKR